MKDGAGSKEGRGPDAPVCGTLYLVGTPIGNRSDLSERAKEILSVVDFVAAEDTRRSGLLLSGLSIRKRLVSYHEHNKVSRSGKVLDALLQGKSVALVSDAGMPCISDPGYELVSLCAENGIRVVVVPGPCAAVTAIAGSGLDGSRFVFEGFLPVKGRERKDRLEVIAAHPVTVVLYEAPHRLCRTLGDLASNGMGKRHIVVARELTKTYEEFLRTTVEDALLHFTETPPRGEFVLVLQGRALPDRRSRAIVTDGSSGVEETSGERTPADLENCIRGMLTEGHSAKVSAARLADDAGLTRNEAYDLVRTVKRSWMEMNEV